MADSAPPDSLARRRVALFHSLDTNVDIVSTEATERFCPQYVRLTAYVEVTFPPLTPAEVQANLARIDAALANSADLHRAAVLSMRTYRDQLLALASPASTAAARSPS